MRSSVTGLWGAALYRGRRQVWSTGDGDWALRDFGVEIIKELNGLSTKDTYPDVTFLLDVPVEIGLARRAATDKNDRLDLESRDFHQKIRDAYLRIAKDEPKRFVIIDASRSIEEVAEDIWEIVVKRFKLQ